jgi:hypothetical protein
MFRMLNAILWQEQRTGRAAADAQLVLLGPDGQAGRAALDQERGELLAIDLGEHGEQIREAGVGDVLLGAGQLPALAVGREHRARLRAQRVGPRAGLGQRVGGDALTARQAGQIVSLLLGGSEQHQRHGADADMGAVTDGKGPEAARALEDQARAGLVTAEAAVLFGHVVAEQTDRAGLLQHRAHHA